MKHLYSIIMEAKTPYVSGAFTSEELEFIEDKNIFHVKIGNIYFIYARQAKSILSHR